MAINKVGSKGIEDGSVASADFAPNTVTSAKLQDGAVTNAKLTNTTVTLAGQSITLGASTTLANKFVDWQSVITAAGSSNTAVSGQGYFIDTTSDVHTVTLPASASIGDFIAIKDYAGTFGTNNLTIARNGHNIQGVANDSLISTNRASLVLVYVDSTKGWLYWEEHNVADLQLNTFISATGGTITTTGDYKIHTFTGDGCFAVSTIGAGASGGPSVVDYLVVAGGGGGGGCLGAGGGAGGYRESKDSTVSSPHTASPLAATTGLTISSTTYPITVGAGGTGGTPAYPFLGISGSPSIFSSITSAGGGGGGGSNTGTPGVSGGSGGGSPYTPAATGGTGNTPPVSPPQGNSGGEGYGSGGDAVAGGGGGAGAVGANASPGGAGTNGGSGVTSSINGTPTTRAGGGGGATNNAPFSGGSGGSGGGGAGGPGNTPYVNGTAGTSNTGGGGGGAGNSQNGGTGGKGIVIIRYKFQ